MKKPFFLTIGFLILPFISLASFDRDLYFGLAGDKDVRSLQEFLTGQKLYSGPINGNFFSLTKTAVKRFQAREEITATGFVGPKTRTQINSMGSVSKDKNDRNTTIAFLEARIKTLMRELEEAKKIQEHELQKVSVSTSTSPAVVSKTPSPVSTSTPVTTPSATTSISTTTTEIIKSSLLFLGESTTTFPLIVVTPLKIGDIVIRNNTHEPILLSQLIVDLYDSMNSPLNRGKSINFVLRNGSTTAEEVIEKKAFTVNSGDPQKQDTLVHRNQIYLSYPVLFAAGETKSSGLWIENFDYVINGTLKFALYDIQTSRTIDKSGGFNFVLTK